jgi:hypothetical protein
MPDCASTNPVPFARVFGGVPHQVCTFQVLRRLTEAILGALAKARAEPAEKKPALSRRRPGMDRPNMPRGGRSGSKRRWVTSSSIATPPFGASSAHVSGKRRRGSALARLGCGPCTR